VEIVGRWKKGLIGIPLSRTDRIAGDAQVLQHVGVTLESGLRLGVGRLASDAPAAASRCASRCQPPKTVIATASAGDHARRDDPEAVFDWSAAGRRSS
jgi:hypothetical protein